MGQFKNQGDCFLTLAEECNELSQAILKKYRFGGEWDDVVEDKGLTRKAIVMDEMSDVLYQMHRCYHQFGLKFDWMIESIDDYDPIDNVEFMDEYQREGLRIQKQIEEYKEKVRQDYWAEVHSDDEPDTEDVPVELPEYVLASTLFTERETFVFHSNAKGEVCDWQELAGMAYRYGDFDWSDHKKAVIGLSDEYNFVRTITNDDKRIQHLYKR